MADDQTNSNNKDDRTPAEKEYDTQIERLDSFFSSLTPGVRLLVERKEPAWCSGVLEEITIQPDDEINLDYFIENWGGHLLAIKMRKKGGTLSGGYLLPLYSYPPLRDGELLKRAEKRGVFREQGEDQMGQQPVIVNQPVPSQALETLLKAIPAILPFLSDWLKNQEARRQADMSLLITALNQRNQSSGLNDVTKIGAVMQQLQGMFAGQAAGAQQPGDSDDFLGNAMDIIKMVMAPGEKPAKPRLTGQPPAPAMAPQMAMGGPGTATVTPLKGPGNIAQAISQMNPQEAANTLLDAIAAMSPDKRNAATAIFLNEYEDTLYDGGEGPEEDDDERRGVK